MARRKVILGICREQLGDQETDAPLDPGLLARPFNSTLKSSDIGGLFGLPYQLEWQLQVVMLDICVARTTT
jgi:hypothetical protein